MFAFKASDQDKLKEIYGRKLVMDVSRGALRDTGLKTRTAISKQVRKVFRVTASKVREKSYVTKNIGTGSEVILAYRDFRPNLGRFSTAASRNVKVKVKKTGGTKLVKGGFRIERYGPLIWKRLSAKEAASPKYAGRKSKIKVLRTIAIPEMVRYASDDSELKHMMQTTFESRFNYRFKRKLGIK